MYSTLLYLWFCQCIGKHQRARFQGVLLPIFFKMFVRKIKLKSTIILVFEGDSNEFYEYWRRWSSSWFFLVHWITPNWVVQGYHENTPKSQAFDNQRGCFSQTDSKSSLLKTRLTHQQEPSLLYSRLLVMGRWFARHTKTNVYSEPTKNAFDQ